MRFPRPRGFLIGLLVFIFLIHVWALLNSGYFHILWLDNVLHFLGGFWLGGVVVFVLFTRIEQGRLRPHILFFLIVLGLVALGGVAWEFFEYGFDFAVTRNGIAPKAQLGVADTMSDLFLDLLGGALAYAVFLRRTE
jgi:hypothetical protein